MIEKEKIPIWNIDSLKEFLVSLIQSNDKRYQESFESQRQAVKDALAAQKELTTAAFNSSEKAIVKAEDAQRDYNQRSNEFRGQLDDQAQTLMPRTESTVITNGLSGRDAELGKQMEILSMRITSIESNKAGKVENKGNINIVYLAIVAGVVMFIQFIGLVIVLFKLFK